MTFSWPTVGNLDLSGRCFLCLGRLNADARGCCWCGVRFEVAWDGEQRTMRNALLGALEPGKWLGPNAGFVLDDVSLRQAASLRNLLFEPDNPSPITGHVDRPARGLLRRPPSTVPDITLVVLARRSDEGVEAMVSSLGSVFAETVIVVDEVETTTQAARPGVKTVHHPLEKDFAAKRNAGQEAVACSWVFHLDTDEMLSPSLCTQLASAAATAEVHGLRAVGFPRANFVDGKLSSLFPDVQYRLLRQDERFEGRVHERPTACQRWWETMIWFGGTIEHRLDLAHVAARKTRYDELGQSGDRRREAESLLEPFPRQSEDPGTRLHSPAPSASR